MEDTMIRPQLRTNRSLAKMFFLGLITLGIYNLVVTTRIAKEVNLLAKDGRHTMHYCLIVFVLSWLTLYIAVYVWNHRLCNRMGNELRRRGIDYDFSASTFWLWNILGAFILVGPFIFTYKFCKASNLLNADYNEKG